MSCGMSIVINQSIHILNSLSGFDIHYMEVDELVITRNYCGKKFDSESIAWEYAKTFAESNSTRFLNIFVVYADTHNPVINYKSKRFMNI